MYILPRPPPYGTKRDAIIGALRTGARTIEEVARATRSSKATTSVYLGKMCQEGRIKRTAHGRYEAV